MTTTQKPAVGAKGVRTAHQRAADEARLIEHVQRSLAAVQKDLTSIGGSLGTGARDLHRDALRMLRDARRDLAKTRKAVQRDLDRLQKDLIATVEGPVTGQAGSAGRRASAPTTHTVRRRATASSH